MGRRGPVGNDQGHRKHAPRTVISIVPRVKTPAVPRADGAWLPKTRGMWREFWRDPLSASIAPTDIPVLRRLFRLRDRWERAMDATEVEIVVRGSEGQVRVHPLADYCSKLEAAMIRLETELGLTPMARARLGITIGEALDSLDEINAKWASVGEHPNTNPPDDPRLAALQLPDQNG
jgi:P27 family predicted phage terminase small subunit